MSLIQSMKMLALALTMSCAIAPTPSVADPIHEAHDACVEILRDGHLEASGWFADADGHVITAGHAVRRGTGAFEVLWPGRGRYPARVIGIDPGHDIGLLKTESPHGPSPFLRLAPSVPPAGSRLHLYGMAQFRHGVSIVGHVARAASTFNYYSHLRWPTRCYLVAAPAPPGVSGGPWLDDAGRVAGTQSGFINQGTASSGLAIVAPPDAIAQLLQARATIRRATMGCGFEELWSQPSGFIRRMPQGAEGIITIPIEPGGPAEKAGLTRESLIRSVDGRPLRHQSEMIAILQSAKPGDTLTLEVFQPDDAVPRTVSLQLGEVTP